MHLYKRDATGLMALAQLDAEIHPWGSHIESVEYPDIVFDLDPSPSSLGKSY